MGARGVIEFSVDSAFGYLKIEQKENICVYPTYSFYLVPSTGC